MAGNRMPPARLLTPYVLYFAFIFACFVYGGLILSGILDSATSDGGEAVAGGTVGAKRSFGLPVPDLVIFALFSISSLSAGLFAGNSLEPRNETTPEAFLQKLQVRLILQAAFCESVAIMGLVGYFFTLGKLQSLAFVAVGLVGLVLLFPGLQSRMDELKGMIRQQEET